RGIRTLERLLTVTHFPGVRLQPLGHLSTQQGAGIYRNWSAKQAGRLRTARFPAFAPKRLVVARPAYSQIMLGGHDRDRVARDHVEEREHHEEEEGRGRKPLQGDELVFCYG